MNVNQQILVHLVSSSINNRKLPVIKNEETNWREIFDASISHNVFPLIYPVLRKVDSMNRPDGPLLLKWHAAAIKAGVRQSSHIDMITKVLGVFHQHEIPVLILKGLFLRELYPHPELRTMSDADILVQTQDIDRARVILIQLGYYEDPLRHDEKHVHFNHAEHLSIELHWTLSNYFPSQNGRSTEELVWDSSILYDFHGVPVYILSLENQLFHLCLHKANHLLGSGFGLRQLCDLTLLVQKKKDSIDWNLFYAQVQAHGITKFVLAIFEVCNKLLGMEIPSSFPVPRCKDNFYINMLIDHILSGGVFGESLTDRRVGNTLLKSADLSKKEHETFIDRIKKYLVLLFPSRRSLGDQFSYVNASVLLVPIAWIHRFLFFFIRKDSSWKEKITYLLSPESINASYERIKLVHWLELK